MDLRCILVAMFVYSSHGYALYWSAAMMRLHLLMSQSIDVLQMSHSMTLSDRAGSYLKLITCSIKSLTYRIPLASCFGGNSVTLKFCHQHVIGSLT